MISLSKKLLLPLFCLALSTANADTWLKSFDFQPKEGATYVAGEPDESQFEDSSQDTHNQAINYHNSAVMAMNAGDSEKAAKYFSYALKLNPENSDDALGLIYALEKCGKYDSTVFNLLKNYADRINQAYTYCMLGLKYLERLDYSKAVETLEKAKELDTKGFSQHAYLRAAFLGGHLKGLATNAKKILKSYPKDINIDSSKRILMSLAHGSYKLVESIGLKIKSASSLETLNLTIRPVANFQNHQKVDLLGIYATSKGKKTPLPTTKEADNTLGVSIPRECWSPDIKLEIEYSIQTKASVNAYFPDDSKPDIENYKNDQLLSLDDERLSILASYIDKRELVDISLVSCPEEAFLCKAAIAITKGLNYKENFVDQSVSWALDNPKNCDCTEFSRLLVALCLKKDIPARLVEGFLVKAESMGKDVQIGHEWCEAYIRGKGWTPIDPTLISIMKMAYFKNLLNDQIFFEYPSMHKSARIGINYTAKNSDVEIVLDSSFRISNL